MAMNKIKINTLNKLKPKKHKNNFLIFQGKESHAKRSPLSK